MPTSSVTQRCKAAGDLDVDPRWRPSGAASSRSTRRRSRLTASSTTPSAGRSALTWFDLLFKLRRARIDSGFGRGVLVAVNDSGRAALEWRAWEAASAERFDGDKAEAQRAAATFYSRAQKASSDAESAAGLTWQVDYNLACGCAIQRTTPAADKAMSLLRGLVRRPHVDQLTRTWAETDPDLTAMRSPKYLPAFEEFVRGLPDKPIAWTTEVGRYVDDERKNLDAVASTNTWILGAEGLFAGHELEPVPLVDLRRVGTASTKLWDTPPSQRAGLPPELTSSVDLLLDDEWRLAVDLLRARAAIKVPTSNLVEAVQVGRRRLGPARSHVVVATEASRAALEGLAEGSGGLSVVYGPPSLRHPLVLTADQPVLTRFVADRTRLDYSVGDDTVRFLVHERVAFVARSDTKAVELTGVG